MFSKAGESEYDKTWTTCCILLPFPIVTMLLCFCYSFTSDFVPCNLPVFTYLHCEDIFYIQILPFCTQPLKMKYLVLPVLLNVPAQVMVSFLFNLTPHLWQSDFFVLQMTNINSSSLFVIPPCLPFSLCRLLYVVTSFMWVFHSLLSLSTVLKLFLLCLHI